MISQHQCTSKVAGSIRQGVKMNKFYLDDEGNVFGIYKDENTYLFDAIGHRMNAGVMLNLMQMRLERLTRSEV